MTNPSLKKKFVFATILIIPSIVLALLVCEVFIRIIKDYTTPEIIRSKSLEYSSSIFARHVFPQKEQNISDRKWLVNSKGYRGKYFTKEKAKGTTRIIIYGGSAVFDQNVIDGNDWPHRIEKLLKEKGLSNVEVINAGIPGHATFDSFGRLFSEGHIFEPDYVLLCNAWNDIKYFSYDEPVLRKFKPLNEKVDFRARYQSDFDKTLCEISQLYVHLRNTYYNWKYKLGPEGMLQVGELKNEINELGPKQYNLNIQMFVDLARNINAVPILVTQPRLAVLENTEEEKSKIIYNYIKMQHEVLVEAFVKTDEAIFNVAELKNVFFIDPSAQMTGDDEYFTDHVHLTEIGSIKMAEILTEKLFSILSNH